MRFALLLTVFIAVAVAMPTPGDAATAALDLVEARSGIPSMGSTGLTATHEALPPPLNMTTEALIGSQNKHPYDGMEILEQTTKSGRKYRIIRPRGSAAAEATAKALSKRCLTCAHFTDHMFWQAGDFDQPSSAFLHETGIEQWSIDTNGWFYKFRLNFRTEQQNNYEFGDESGDWYGCNVWVTGNHYIDYNSDKPNMVTIQGV